MEFTVKNICGYYAICQDGTPMLLCHGLTTANTIIKLIESDSVGDVSDLCYIDESELEKRKHGHWIFNDDNANMVHWYTCSKCDCNLPLMYEKTNYCPRCGSKMDEREVKK